MLSQSNEYFDDAVLVQGNEIGGHKFTFRTAIPTGAWRSYYQGTPYSSSKTAQAHISVGSLEGNSQIDKMQAEDSGDPEEFRETEDMAFLEGFSQTMVGTQFYGNTTASPAEFMGLSPFYNTVNAAVATNAANVIDGGGTGSSNASLWLVCHGRGKIFNVYPKGAKVGLEQEDLGDVVPGYDSLGNPFRAWTTYFRWQMGLCPQDWRYGVRMANLDVTAAGLAGPNAYDIFAGLAQVMLKPPALGKMISGIVKTDAPRDLVLGSRPCLYANRTIRKWMDIQMIRDRNVLLSINDYAGRPCEAYRGVPIRVCDQLLNTEARVI
jgi:hypothetical protein